MPPRGNEPPRRGSDPRRGVSRVDDPDTHDDEEPDGVRGFGGIADARAYTPRGRTVREAGDRGRIPRTDRSRDPFRPALQVLDGGQPTRRGDDRRGPRAGASPDAPDGTGRRAASEAGRSEPDHPPRRESAADASGERHRDAPPRGDTGRRRIAGETPARRTTRAGAGARTTASATRSSRPTATERTAGRLAPVPRRENTSATRRDTGRRAAPRAGGAPPKRPAPPPTDPPPLADGHRRLRLSTLLALAVFAVIGIRLVSLQVIDTPAFAESVLKQRQDRLTTVVLPAPRGSILDRHGAVLAQSVEARYVYADPTLVTDPAAAAATLSPLLGVAQSELRQKLVQQSRPGGGPSRFEYLARGVDIAVADRIQQLKLTGIGVHRDERRDVPGADLAANLIGFTGDDLTGLEGLEARYDDLLRGQDGKRVFEIGNPDLPDVDLAKEIPGGYSQETKPKPGSSLTLTIDRDLQFEVQRILGADMAKVGAAIGAAVVIDVRTGEVLAQASYPAYNAAKPFQYKPAERVDVASSVVADPGSTHKAFIFGAALQEGIINPDSTLVVGPGLRRGGYSFRDTHPYPAGTRLTMPGLLAYSSNVGTIRIADRLTPARVYEYQQKFGLGKPTNEGVPGEASGRLLPPHQWSPSASGSIPVGMSVDATLIQMAAGFAAIANDGTYIQPHLIKATVGADGTVTRAPAPETRPVLSPANAAALRTMMEAVVAVPGATGNLAKVAGYRVAGKTGTGKRLVGGKYTSYEAGSFVGMAPAENPRYVVAVFADTPSGSGGVVAGPAFRKMMAFALAHDRVPPSGTKPPKFKIFP